MNIDELFNLLPAIVRQRDAEVGGLLKLVFEAFVEEVNRIESNTANDYDNMFVETCEARFLPYIADLIAYRPISVSPSGAGSLPIQSERHAELRRDIAATIRTRRRKGTVSGIAEAVRAVSGWSTAIFENGRNVVSTASLRFPGVLSTQGTPDFRRLTGRDGVDQGPGLIPRVATVRRVDQHGERGRWHPFDIVVEAWPQRARLRTLSPVSSGNGYLCFDPSGANTQLYAPVNSEDEGPVLVSARAVRLSDFVGDGNVKQSVYGENRAICLFWQTVDGLWTPVKGDYVAFGPVPLPAGPLWIIDPELGRLQAPVEYSGGVGVRYFCALASTDKMRCTLPDAVVGVRLKELVPLEARVGLVVRN